jgi:predicted MFS family arabinose efflux permease
MRSLAAMQISTTPEARPMDTATSQPPGHSRVYSGYVLLILLVVSAFNFFDRFLLVITMESIKHDLGLSDTQLGLLTGFAFTAVYTTAGIFVARWADRGNRRNIMTLGLAIWSTMTALCAGAGNFLHLALCRLGVGLGESACTPPAHSMISDYFSPTQRATAVAIYGLGLYLGLGLGFGLGGWVNEHYGWRMAFLVGGLPGLAMAVLLRFTVREPARGQTDDASVDARDYSITDVLRYITQRRAFLAYVIGTGLFVFSGNATEYWGASFLIRIHGLGSAEVGSKMGLLGSTAGMLGILVFAILADRMAGRDLRWYLWVSSAGAGMMVPFVLLFLFDDGSRVFFHYFLATFFGATYMAPVVALTQRLLPLRMRALSSAIILLSFNLIGITAGNFITGLLSDLLEPSLGVESLRYALALTMLGTLGGIVLMQYSARRLPMDVAAANAH